MTREEATRRIECCRNFLANNYFDMGEPNFTAFNMAIKALEQKPCDDTVSREDAKSFLYERLNRLNNDELYDIFSVIIDDMYNELPPVQLKSGWIPVDDSLDAYIEKE